MILIWRDIFSKEPKTLKLFHICEKIDSSMNIVGCRPNSFEHESQSLILVNVTLKLHSLLLLTF